MNIAILAGSLVALSLAPTGSATAQQPIDETPFLRAAGQADLSAMPEYFASPAHAGNPLLEELRDGFQARFVSRTERYAPGTGIALIDETVTSFRDYWAEALMDPPDKAGAESRLLTRLQSVARGSSADSSVLDAVARDIRARGYGISISRTPPLSDLVIWGTEERAYYQVDLTDGTENVEVVFVDDLVSEGWRHFASLGLHTTSGWTDGGALYCVRFTYDPDSEPFRVSYLKHETRHFADFRRFPGLDEATMEYRAKLTELAFANLTAPILLRRFALERDARSPSAHLRANDRVSRELYRAVFGRPMPEDIGAWPVGGVNRVNLAARRLLDRSTSSLESAAAASAAGSQ